MTKSGRNWLAVALFVIALGCASYAVALWQSANDDAAQAKTANIIGEAFDRPAQDSSPDHTGSYVLFGVAGVAVVGGFIMLASAPPREEGRAPKDAPDHGSSF